MSPEPTTTSADERPTSWRERLRDPGFLALVVPLAVYLVLSLGGITTSSIGVDPLREDPAHPSGHEIGTPQMIRADEWRTDSPIALGWITTGGRGIDNPLNVPPNIFQQLPSGPISSITFFDGTAARLGPWLPDAMVFAAKWWLPTLMLFLGMPALFRFLTGKRRWGYLAAVLIFFSPTNAWWSGWPVNTLGFLSASMAMLLLAHRLLSEGRRRSAVAAALVSGVLMARYPTYYQPYAIIVGFPLLAATLAHLLVRTGPVRPKVLALVTAGVTGAVLAAGTMLENLDSIKVGLDTVYPGQRINTAVHMPFGKIFGATDLGFLPHTQTGLTASNASETSSSFIVLFLVALIIRFAGHWKGSRSSNAVFWVLTGFTAFWLMWCTVNLGEFGEKLPLINLVPAMRAANTVGFIAILMFCVAMSQWEPARNAARLTATASAVVVAAVSLFAGWSLHDAIMPLLTNQMIWFSSLAAAAVVFALVRWPTRAPALGVVMAAAVALTIAVNPIEIGLGDLRDSSTARYFITAGTQARANRTLWATDTAELDSLLFATGTPSLTSRQQLGPNREEWYKFDPGGVHENLWNRGGTYPHFYWTAEPGIAWSGHSLNHVILQLSPCTAAGIEPRLTHIVSTKRLDLSCLTLDRTVRWGGKKQFVYSVS